MGTAYLVLTILLAAMLVFSGLGKLRRDPRVVRVIHELIGVPMKYVRANHFGGDQERSATGAG